MEYAASVRGLATIRWSREEILVEAPEGAVPIYFHAMNGPRSTVAGRFYCLEKTVARDILRRAGLSVAISHAFDPGDLTGGRRWAQRVGYPVVTKPTNAWQGRGVTANVQTPEELEAAWRRARSAHPWFRVGVVFARSVREAAMPRRARGLPARVAAYTEAIRDASMTAWGRRWSRVLLEKHVDGFDFRFFVVGDEVVSVTQRKPANVLGDGRATVLELIQSKNAVRAENPHLSNYPIPTSLKLLDLLAGAGLNLSYVPSAGELVVLRSASNFSAGGDSVDVTEDAHLGFTDIAIRAVRAIPGVEYAGVDVITPDITVPPTAENHIVSEVEYSPGLGPAFPLVGVGRDMAGAILDYYLRHLARDANPSPDPIWTY